MPNYGQQEELDPRIQQYLQDLQSRRSMDADKENDINSRSLSAQNTNTMIGGIGAGLAQMGSIGGHVASAAPLQQTMGDLNQQISSGEKQQYGSLQKSGELREKVTQHLMDMQQKKQAMDASKQQQDRQFSENMEFKKSTARDNADIRRTLADSKAGDAEKKSNDASEKTYTEMIDAINKPRGNTAVQQSSVNLRNIQSAKDLINLYPDTNKMPSEQVSSLVGELAKIANGGVASEHTQRSMEANTLNSNFQKFLSKVGNEPKGAELGAFINQNKMYLDALEKTNRDVVNNYGKSMYQGRSHRLNADQQQRFKLENPDYFQESKPQVAKQPAPPAGGFGTANAGIGGGDNNVASPEEVEKVYADYLKNPTGPRREAQSKFLRDAGRIK